MTSHKSSQPAERSTRRQRSGLRRLLLHEMWGVFVIDHPVDPLAPGIGDDARPLLVPNESTFWADPFFVTDDTLLVEEYDFRTGIGRILSVPVDDPAAMRPALSDHIHSSFPFVVHFDPNAAATPYVIPERAGRNRLEIYAYDAGEGTLELVHVALEGHEILDPVVWFDPATELYFLFFCDGPPPGYEQLRLFVCDRLDGEWQEHPASPIRNDALGGRPAGPIWSDGTQLIRFGQDNLTSYGEAIASFRIDTIDASEYSETMVELTRSTVPGFSEGVHTISWSPDGNRFAIDARRFHHTFRSRAVAAERFGRLAGKFNPARLRSGP